MSMFRQIINYKRFIILLVTVLFVAVLLFPEIQRRPVFFLGRPLVYIISMLQKALTQTADGFAFIWRDYIDLVSVRRENDRLKQDLARMQSETIRLQEAALANDRLQQLLDFKKTNPYPMVAALVIGRDPSNWYRTLMIDKGTRDGIAIDMGVISPVGVVGRVIKTDPTVSQVLLVTDRNSAVAALIQGTRDEGLVEGTERGLARIKYLSLLADLKAGDLVLTSGLTGIFPKGLLIGTLGRVTKNDQDLFQQAEVIPRVDFSKLEEVLVITSPGNQIPPNDRAGLPAEKGPKEKK